MHIDENTHLCPASKELPATALNDELVVLNHQRDVYCSLKGIGPTIWSLVQQPRSVGEIVDIVTERYDVPREQCSRDVVRFVAQLSDLGLVRTSDAEVD